MRPRRRQQAYLPLGYLAAAMAIAALLLPSILRPPQDQQTTSTAFSPDAPPDDTPPEALLQSLRRASSSTAGGTTFGAEEIVEVEEATGPAQKKRPSRGKCFGDPPRQTESLYSALCVPAFTGTDNGGKTAPGVYPDEIRVAIAIAQRSPTPAGRLSRDFSETDTDETHHLKVWQTYFNDRFETYGRYLQFYVIKQPAAGDDAQRASVGTAKNDFDAFVMFGNGAAATNEAIRLKIIDFGALTNPADFYNSAFPYAYSFYMDGFQNRYLGAELACKQFQGKPPGALNQKQDATFDYSAPRVFGLITYQDPTRQGATAMTKDLFARCGGEFKATQEYNLTDNQGSIAGTTAKMKAAGVTTILFGTDSVTPIQLMSEADSLQYYPEWIHAGAGGVDINTEASRYADNQSRHLIGFSPNELRGRWRTLTGTAPTRRSTPTASPMARSSAPSSSSPAVSSTRVRTSTSRPSGRDCSSSRIARQTRSGPSAAATANGWTSSPCATRPTWIT